MEKLIHDLQRLYFLPEQQWHFAVPDERGAPAYSAAVITTPALLTKSLGGEIAPAFDLISADGHVRTLVVGFAGAVDWARVATVYAAVQTDLALPAPALSIVGLGGYQLWFSLADAVPLEAAQAFLDGLCLRYLADIPAAQLTFHPALHASSGPSQLHLVPARHAASDRWSAFIDPSLGSMFADESGLEMAPSMDGQSDILAKFVSIKADEFQRVLDNVSAESKSAISLAAKPETQPDNAGRSTLNLGGHYSDPKSFLLAVMNDPRASADQRIEAAKALLPYFEATEKK